MKNKIDKLEKEIEQTKIYSMENREVNKTAFYEANRRVIFLDGKLEGYKEAQNYLNEIIQQYNRDYINKKETEKNIIYEIENTFPEKDIAILKQIIQKHLGGENE